MRPPASLAPVVRGLHHVAIAVPSIAAARRVFVDLLGLSAGEIERVEDQKVNVLVCHAGPQRIELVEPAAEDSPVSGFLARRGAGLHHLAWSVDDCAEAIERLKSAGLALIDSAPRRGAHGTRVAFVHPKATGGVLCELVEEPRHD